MGKTGNKKERRRVDREVAADLKKRNPRSTSGRSVPLQQNRAPVHTQTRVNGQLSREQKTIRNIAHKSGAGGCDPLMSSVIGAITHPFSKVNHVVMPRSNMSYLLNQNFVSGCGMTCDHRDIPRGTLNQYDYLVTATTSTSGNLRIDIPSFGAPFKTNATPGLTLAPLFSSTTYAGTTWTITNSVEAYGACPATGPGFSGVQEGAQKWSCIGFKMTFENMVQTIADQKGTLVLGQNVGINPLFLTAADMGTAWWTTTYDAATTVAQPSISLIPDGRWYDEGDFTAPSHTQKLSMNRTGLIAIGSGFTAGISINIRIQAAYIWVGHEVSPTTPIIYHTPSFECGVICAGFEQASLTYEENTGGDPLNSKAAANVRREAQKRGSAMSNMAIPDWLVQTGQAVLPHMGTILEAALSL